MRFNWGVCGTFISICVQVRVTEEIDCLPLSSCLVLVVVVVV